MGNIERLKRFTLSCCFLVAAVAIIASGSPKNKQTKKHQSRQGLQQKCDLICPGQPIYPLPPNFIQNCTFNNNTLSKPPVAVTTVKPAITTEDNEDIDNNNTTKENETARVAKHIHKIKIYRWALDRYMHQKSAGQKHELKEKAHEHWRHALRKQTVMLKKRAKSRLFSQHTGLKERSRLEGCYVICEEPSVTNSGVEPDGGSEPEGSDEDTDGDNYVEGEDQPLEIIYVPSQPEETRRPYDIYQHNADLLPQFPLTPQFEVEPGLELWEDKNKGIKKRKQHTAKSKDGNLPLKHHA